MDKKAQKRRSRFERDPSVTIRITERDREMIRHIYKRRFMNSDQVVALTPGSAQGIKRRLGKMFHKGYLDRPRAQLEIAPPGENFPMVYGLGNRGADLIAVETDSTPASVDWTSKNREAGSIFLEHTLMVSEFLTAVEAACLARDDIEFIDSVEIVERRQIRPADGANPLSWKVSVQRGEGEQAKKYNFHVIPDGAFGLRFHEEGATREAYFFLEADRSTMPVKRSNLYRSSFYKKMAGYISSFRQKLYGKYFRFSKARILTLAISNQRIETMIEVNKQLHPKDEGYRLFLFTRDKAIDVKNPGRVLKKIWLNGRGEKTSLVD